MKSNSCPHILDPELAQYYAQSQINHKIMTEIATGHLQIPSQQLPLIASSLQSPEARAALIEKVRLSKDKAIKQLHDLDNKERQLKQELIKLSKSRSKSKTPERSSFTEEEKNRIKNILKEKKKKEKLGLIRHEAILKSLQDKLKQEDEQKRKKIERLKQEHHKSAEKHLAALPEQQEQRIRANQATIRQMKELRSKRYIFKIKQAEDENKARIESEAINNKLQRIRERFKLDFTEIREHSKRVKTHQQERENERKQQAKLMTLNQEETRMRFEPSQFHKILEEEEREKRIQAHREAQKPREQKQKIRNFGEYVRNNFKPAQQSSPTIVSDFHTKPKDALSLEERNKSGNENLKVAKTRRKQKSEVQVVTQPQIRYKNYLRSTGRSDSVRNKTASKLKSLLATPSIDDYETASQAKAYLSELECKSKKSTDEKVIQSIKHKLELLRALS